MLSTPSLLLFFSSILVTYKAQSLRINFESTPAAAAQPTTVYTKIGCPRSADIHPCECIEIPKAGSLDGGIETVAFCKTIRNAQVLQNAMKGMQGHTIDFMVLDSCKLPPFPNGLFFNIGIRWMEILNSTVQFKQEFFNCAGNCW